jgi:CRP/FNR family transcriptional regulator, cyclic AMP receptor protein
MDSAQARELDALLAQNPVFARLTSQDRLRLCAEARLRSYAAREVVIQEKDEPRVFILVKGSVRVYHTSPNGLEVVVKIFKPPSIFGEDKVIVGMPFLENVAALESAEVLEIPRAVFLELLARQHTVALALLTDVCARLAIASHNERSLAFHDVRTRLANFLVHYAEFDGKTTARGVLIRLRLTQDDMAQALGVTRRAVAKEIIRWKKDGLLEQNAGRYLIRDMHRLAAEAADPQLGISYAIGRPLGQLPQD